MESDKIVEARIEPENPTWPGRDVLVVKLEGQSSEERLFGWYTDELHFSAGQFIGKTVREASSIRHQTDVRYLRS